jgi:DNA primase
MQISEEALFSALAQLNQKNKQIGSKKIIAKPEKTLLKKTKTPSLKVDQIFELEKQIIFILLTYGNLELDFEDSIMQTDDKGELIEESKTSNVKVYEKIFLDLQEDEVELSNDNFRNLFYQLVESHQKYGGNINLEKLMQSNDLDQNEIITDLVMRHEQHQLHEWEKRNIFVKNKGTEVVQLVSETILSLRRFLIDQKIIELQEQTKLNNKNDDILQDILSYQQLKKVISKKLNRVL